MRGRGSKVPSVRSFGKGGTEYQPAELGKLRGEAEFNSIAPYVGIGFGNALSRQHRGGFTMDLGVSLRRVSRCDIVRHSHRPHYSCVPASFLVEIPMHVLPRNLTQSEAPQQIYDEVRARGLPVDYLVNMERREKK